MRLFGRARGRAGRGSTVFKAESIDETSESMRSRSSWVEMGDLGDGIEVIALIGVAKAVGDGRKKGDELIIVGHGFGSDL